MRWYVKALKKYAVFEGRAGRKEFWSFMFFNFVIMCLLPAVVHQLGIMKITAITGIYHLAILIPSAAAVVRRLHDTNRSGLWGLIGFVPIGIIVLVVFLLQSGNDSDNQYGSPPTQKT